MVDAAKLPPDLVAEILHRLPVRDLLRCRCVNKLWLSLIDDRSFISKHLRYMSGSAGAENHSIILLRAGQNLRSIEMEPPYRVRELQPPPRRSGSKIVLVGSCNGLLCLSSLASGAAEDVALWNPLTNDHAHLPIVPFGNFGSISMIIEGVTMIMMSSFAVIGFGYDSVTGDYKVVIIESVSKEEEQFQDIRFYSLLKNSWMRFRDDRYWLCLPQNRKMGVYVNNNLHWVMTRRSDSNATRLIVAFDLRTEDYKESFVLIIDNQFGVDVTVLEGCLGMVVNSHHYNVADVWIMREYGSRESWAMLFSVPYYEVLEFDNDYYGDVCYLEPSYSGGQLLVADMYKKYLWFDAKNQTFRTFNISDFDSCNVGYESFNAAVCAESLVQVGT
ncbi:hypothetical protein CRG98_046509 [Punica granatum]|uniref:F-box domain-containing protein n=1 Tax=Punica granatum TaxID=22663 RepID=A0A2I0HNQ5_PUNGR|nr:hypothetical protein CRG98_046509 [Punica granatum]